MDLFSSQRRRRLIAFSPISDRPLFLRRLPPTSPSTSSLTIAPGVCMTTTNNHLQHLNEAMLTEEERVRYYKFLERFVEAPTKNNDAVVASMDLLPDGILSDIISCFTLRDAVRTSVLARRWRFLSASLPNLNFDWPSVLGIRDDPFICEKSTINYHNCQHRFVKIVDQILNNYVGTRILTFRISFCVGREFSYEIGQWISLAVRLGVESLQLQFSCDQFLLEGAAKKPVECKHKEYYIFPCHLLPPSKESMLKQLLLQSCTIGPDLNDRFSSLITLKLFDVPLAQSDVEIIFSSCLNIECLNLEWCSLPITLVVCSSLLRLKSLVIWCCFDVKEIELSAPNMTTFEYRGDLVSFSFLEVRNLEKLQFVVECDRGLGYVFSQLGKVVPPVKALSVISVTDWVEQIPERILTFTNVKKLELYFYKRTVFHIPKIFAILEACPLLQNFHLVTHSSAFADAFESAKLGELTHNHLKEVGVGAFFGSKSQILFLMQLVEYAAVLERLRVNVDSDFHRGGIYWTVGASWCRPVDNSLAKKLQERATSKKAVISLVV